MSGEHITRVDDDSTGSAASCTCGWSARVERSDERILVPSGLDLENSHYVEGLRAKGARMRAHFAAYAHRMANQP